MTPSDTLNKVSSADHGDHPFNENHARYLRVTCQHIDKLLGEIEGILNESASGTVFPHYISDLAPVQRRMIEDNIAHIRGRFIRVLDGQHISREPPSIPASRNIRHILVSLDGAIDEMKPKYLQGFGNISRDLAGDLEGISGELHGMIVRLDQNLAGESGYDLNARLKRLEAAGNNLELLSRIEKVVADRGLVEFRGTISSILDRVEDRAFEIAIFGRVSSGKSSLLNALFEADILPIGVTPVTAVPVRILFGEKPSAVITFVQAPAQTVDVSRLSEYSTEQQNPENKKQVTRITVSVPARRLRSGVAFVDTPGLGSLATSGAAETRAYLPRCDLGIVLIDAGSTLTSGDLGTLAALHEAAIPVMVLLSKADVLNQQDCSTLAAYVRQHIRDECGIDVPVHPVSVHPSHKHLFEGWFETGIQPLYSHSQELRDASMQRKIGALRESVVTALSLQIRRSQSGSQTDGENIRSTETRLRRATGEIAQIRSVFEKESQGKSDLAATIASRAAARILKNGQEKREPENPPDQEVYAAMTEIVQKECETIQKQLEDLASRLSETLEKCAEDLEIPDRPGNNEFSSLIRDMPLFDPGTISISISSPGYTAILGKQYVRDHLENQIRHQLDGSGGYSVAKYQKRLQDWATAIVIRLGDQFATYAERYQAQAGRSLEGSTLTAGDVQAIEKDLALLGDAGTDTVS